MIYSSGRESFFNLNSTWYDPSGSWLDTRRTPFRYGYSTCCSSGCDGEGVEGMRGHDYRCYGYRQPRCGERCHGGSGSAGSCHGCVRRPTYSYGASGGCQGYGRSVCSEGCHGSAGSCHGGGSGCVRRPTYSSGGSGGCQGYGRSVCSERCHGSSGTAQGYGRSVCSERCHSGGQGGKPCCGKPAQTIPVQVCPPPVQVCPQPVQTCPCPAPVQVCPRPCPPQVKQVCPPPCPPPVKQSCVPVPKGIPRPQQKICTIPAQKIK